MPRKPDKEIENVWACLRSAGNATVVRPADRINPIRNGIYYRHGRDKEKRKLRTDTDPYGARIRLTLELV